MTAAVSTSTTRRILGEPLERYDRCLEKRELRALEWAARLAQKAFRDSEAVRIEPYTPYLNAPSNWLPSVESRIRGSVLPEGYEGKPSTEWLSENAAIAAIAFFQNGADLLPTEPHIYGTQSGDLVAEFETATGSLTSVVSDKQIILFAVLTADPHEPIHSIIRRGSNQFRDELRSFTTKLATGSHGQMESAK